MSKRRRITLLILAGVFVCLSIFIIRTIYYTYNTGSRSGRVTDPNGNPLQGVVVTYAWRKGSFISSGLAVSFETTTDAAGKYFVPSQYYDKKHYFESLESERVFIYKDGFAPYTINTNLIGEKGRVGIIQYDKQTYRKKNNLVILPHWRHEETIKNYIDGIKLETQYFGKGPLLKREIAKGIDR